MNRTARALPFAAVLLLPAGAGAQTPDYPSQENYGIRLEYREFRPDLTGEIQKGFGTEEGTLVDVVDDLGLQDDRTFEARISLQFKRGHKLKGSYTPLDYAGDQDAPRKFTYGQTDFLRGQRVVSRLKGGYYSADYEWDFVKGPRGFLGATLGAKLVDLDATLVAPDQGQREQNTLRSPIPSLGLATRIYASRVSLEGEVSGFTLGDRGHLIEFGASAHVHFSDRMAVGGGYRYVKVKGHDDRDSGDLTLAGWHFGLELSI
jgi:hypothetical protein